MGLLLVKKRPRRPAPELPDGDIQVESPPELPTAGGRNWSQALMVLPMVAGSGAMMLMMMTSGTSGAAGGMGLRAATGGLFGVSMLGMVVMNMFQGGRGPNKQEMMQIRRDFLRKLSQIRRQVHKTRREQRRGLYYRHPDPDTLWSSVSSARLWERRTGDGDFAVIRMGLGPQQLATPIRVPQTKPIEDLEPLCTAALRKFLDTNAVVNDLPVAMDLRGFSKMFFRGDTDKSRALVRAMIAQLCTWQSPDELLVAVCASPPNMAHWDWMKWMPHVLHPADTDALGQVRLMGNSLREIEERFGDVLTGRPRFNPASTPWDGHHVVVIMDGGDTRGADHLTTEGGVEGVTILDLTTPPPRQLEPGLLMLQFREDGTLRMGTVDAIDDIRKPDSLSQPEAEALARRLAPLRQSAAGPGDGDDDSGFSGTNLTFTDLLDVGDPYDFNPDRAWAPRPNRDRLRIPIGVGPDGLPVDLDIKESAQDGMGPHGLMIGATGSGKSEALRTLVLALAAVHSPEILNFVLVDFKGGATFTRLDKLPHTSAVITNLSDELVLVDRMKDAIEGETIRRQEELRKHGKFASLRDYEKARAAGAPIPPMPSLLIICDEFSELLTAKPDFIDMFVQIGRVGRSLGVHLLLASQRLEEGKLRGLDTHLSYRIGLRTFSAIESRTVLGVSDAYELPRAPGHGYLRFGTEPLIRFRASYVSGVYQRSAAEKAIAASGGPQVREFTGTFVAPPPKPEPEPGVTETVEDDDEKVGESLLDILVSKMEGKGTPAHQVWLPPLDVPPTLDEFLQLTTTPERGLNTARQDLHGGLNIPVALVDKPFEQRRDIHWLNLTGAAGHIAVAGGTQSGKSTALRSIIGSIALTHTPAEAAIYCIDLGGGALSTVRDLPHVGAVYQRLDADEVRRTAAEVFNAMEAREQRFATKGIDSMSTYRKMRADGRITDDPWGDIFLVVDGWMSLRQDFDEVEQIVTQIAQRGLSFGVHVIAAAAKWGDFRPAIRDVFGSKVELKVADAFDSIAGRRVAENVPADRPGRGITADSLHMLTALPRVDGKPEAGGALADGIEDMVSKIKDAWQGPPVPAVRLLPAELPYNSLPLDRYDESTKWKIPFGIAESNLKPVYLELDVEPHFMLISDVETGKSAFLRQLIKTIISRNTSKQATFVLFDYRRSLLGTVPENYLIKHCSTTDQSTDLVKSLVAAAKQRMPPDNVTPQQLRERSWWTGPEIFMIVDDYDLVGQGMNNPLMPLIEILPQARDLGMHFIVTRRSGGAGRDLYGKVLGSLKDLASPAFQGSGPKIEGKLLGDIKMSTMPPGRGWFITRKFGNQKVQTAWLPPEDD
ncbi:type VII secretion protein EccC [Stackebrandtia nassauensis]|uniref:Cell division FtsK/SpoIIIE n=1 Tax=Stackebrandtia nassauensis (strain DSM 44728 / CIP 108903 / NRRL B-16338 / NBRC 102104 / LLR-40K-21) TaxID=446470 RepID=D3Q708_STANL|nr:type VII secretion protein EccC [Stackebrandtia nassauensis]ADD40407.1 cell division FtsK/SpoIIIE [Stackebrandtia nassauensis DSM 44728]